MVSPRAVQVAVVGLVLLATTLSPVRVEAAPVLLVGDPVSYVDPSIGITRGGNTWPGATRPFGMIAWSPTSTTGLFPRVPGRAEMLLGSPVFTRVVIDRGNGVRMTVNADSTGTYVQGVRFRGRDRSGAWLPETYVRRGGTVTFTLGAEPDTTWATGRRTCPGTTDGQPAGPDTPEVGRCGGTGSGDRARYAADRGRPSIRTPMLIEKLYGADGMTVHQYVHFRIRWPKPFA